MIGYKKTLAALALFSAPACAFAFGPARVAEPRPTIDVAFCIDTTGSMQPYIDATKTRIWEIANGLLKGTPRPIVRMAVVAYRDRGDAYITQKLDLTDDIDAVHKYLMALNADGGGDEPEHVTAGLRECVDRLTWSQKKRVLKMIYLVGDAPAHVDYDDGDYHPVIKKAISQGITVSTIACAGANEVAQWKEIAKLADGQFIQLPPRTFAAAPGGVPEMSAGRAIRAAAGAAPAAMAAPSAMAADEAVSKTLSDSVLDGVRAKAKEKGIASY